MDFPLFSSLFEGEIEVKSIIFDPFWSLLERQEVSLAYEVLTDPARRQAHDEERLRQGAEVGCTRKLRLRRNRPWFSSKIN